MKEQRFLRSKRLRAALWASTDGRCAICGVELGEGWHADHVVPWSKTHRTNVHEMQPLCAACNLKKGSSYMKLRKHQETLRKIASDMESGGDRVDILADIVAGGGKSMLGGIMAQAKPNHKIAWFVPRLSLKSQAAIGLSEKLGIDIREADNSDIDPSRGSRGFVTTHQSLMMNPGLWRHELERHNYILVIDELHHAKVNKDGSLGQLAAAIHELPASIRLLMTGTLETNDGKQIYGVPYVQEGNTLRVDLDRFRGHVVSYSRADAISEGAVVPLEIRYADGPLSWQSEEGMVTVDLSSTKREHESSAIFTALQTEFANELLDRCVDHFKQYGRKLLVVASSQSDARKFMKRLSRVGIQSGLAISDEPSSHATIDAFAHTDLNCLVTCQMAYEGLDVPDITHIACLTRIRSVPWIEQMLARAWRSSPGKERCWAFAPKDPRMDRTIERIRHETDAVLYINDREGPGPGGENEIVVPMDGSIESMLFAMLDGECNVEDEVHDRMIDLFRQLGIDHLSSEAIELVDRVRKLRKAGLRPETVREREDRLRKSIADTCRQMDSAHAMKYGLDPKKTFGTHQKILKAKTRKSIKVMNEQELKHAAAICPTLRP